MKKMEPLRRCFWEMLPNLLLLLCLPPLVITLIYLAGSYGELHRPVELPQILDYELPPGFGLIRVSQDWHDMGLIQYPRSMVLLARLGGQGQDFKTGAYRLYPGETPWRMLQRLRSAETRQYRLTIPEGWTLVQLLHRLQRSPQLRQVLPADPERAKQALSAALKLPDVALEGLFLPETYYYVAGNSDLDVLRRAYQALREALQAEWEERAPDLPLKTAYEALVLASIVERESLLLREHPIIAGVFIRRLRIGMRLQADPTVSYGKYGHYRRLLRSSDLRHDSPYNTYRKAGLPPTPIALPSRRAIRAVLHPAEGTALYFVAHGDGSHIFSRTLQEHNSAVAQLRARRNSRRKSSVDTSSSREAHPGATL